MIKKIKIKNKNRGRAEKKNAKKKNPISLAGRILSSFKS